MTYSNHLATIAIINKGFLGVNHILIFVRIASDWCKEHDPSAPCYLRHFQIFDKIDSFPKKFLNAFRIKKGKELSNLYLIVLLISFFPLLLWITAENITKLKKLFNWTTKSGGTQHYENINCTRLFISNYNNASDILNWTWFLNYIWFQEFSQQQTKKLINKQKFLSPANTQSPSEESLKEKRHTFIGMCSLFTCFNMQILNLCHRWHRCIHKPLWYLKWRVLRK